MKEYKRCKFCSMEMDKSSIKCPHCNKVQTGKFSFGDKSENLIVAVLVVIAVIVGVSNTSFNISDSFASFKSNFSNWEFFGDDFKNIKNEFNEIITYFGEDNESFDDYSEDYSYEAYAEDIAIEFDNDFEYAYDEYCDSVIKLDGLISDIVEGNAGKYLYLNTYNDDYSMFIFIPKDDYDHFDDLNNLNLDDFVSYVGTLYYDESKSTDDKHYLYICDGYFDM